MGIKYVIGEDAEEVPPRLRVFLEEGPGGAVSLVAETRDGRRGYIAKLRADGALELASALDGTGPGEILKCVPSESGGHIIIERD